MREIQAGEFKSRFDFIPRFKQILCNRDFRRENPSLCIFNNGMLN